MRFLTACKNAGGETHAKQVLRHPHPLILCNCTLPSYRYLCFRVFVLLLAMKGFVIGHSEEVSHPSVTHPEQFKQTEGIPAFHQESLAMSQMSSKTQ